MNERFVPPGSGRGHRMPAERHAPEAANERAKPLDDLAAVRQTGRIAAAEIDGLEIKMRGSKRKAFPAQLLDAQKSFFLSDLKSNDPEIVKRAVANLEWLRDSVQRRELRDAVESETEVADAELSVEPELTDAVSQSSPEETSEDGARRPEDPLRDFKEPEVVEWQSVERGYPMDQRLYSPNRPLPKDASVPLSARIRSLRTWSLGKSLSTFLAAFGMLGISSTSTKAPEIGELQQPHHSMSQPVGAPVTSVEQEMKGPIVEKVPKKLLVHNLADLTLKRGSSGPHVRELQKFLNTHGFKVAEKGRGSLGNETTDFGPLTEVALKQFQEACKKQGGRCSISGRFGASTWKEIERLYGSAGVWWEFSSDLAHRTRKK